MRKPEIRAVRTPYPRVAFPRPRHTDTWSQMTVEGCPVHWRVFSSTPGLYPLNASCDNKNGLQTLLMCPGEQTAPIEDHCPRPMSRQEKFLPPVGLKSTRISSLSSFFTPGPKRSKESPLTELHAPQG